MNKKLENHTEPKSHAMIYSEKNIICKFSAYIFGICVSMHTLVNYAPSSKN